MFNPPNVSGVRCQVSHVTCHMSRVTCHVSHVRFFFVFWQSCEASQGRVCYQRSLPRLVLKVQNRLIMVFWKSDLNGGELFLGSFFKMKKPNTLEHATVLVVTWEKLDCIKTLLSRAPIYGRKYFTVHCLKDTFHSILPRADTGCSVNWEIHLLKRAIFK